MAVKKEMVFDVERWNDDPKHRYLMVEDLKQKYDFYSMTKEEIIDLLGTKSVYIGVNCVRYDTGGGFLRDEVLD